MSESIAAMLQQLNQEAWHQQLGVVIVEGLEILEQMPDLEDAAKALDGSFIGASDDESTRVPMEMFWASLSLEDRRLLCTTVNVSVGSFHDEGAPDKEAMMEGKTPESIRDAFMSRVPEGAEIQTAEG